jgi:hypothetical protein
MKAVFIHLDGFKRDLKRLKMTDEDLQSIERAIMDSPNDPVMKGTGGIRKMRYAPAHRHGGKSGGCRVCYVWFPEFAVALLVICFAKNEQPNLTPAQRTAFQNVIEAIRSNLRKGRY